MRDLNDLFFFVQVVDHGGFAPAARALGLPKSRLSRRVAELEARLGARLLQRTTRRFAVTGIGQEFYRHAAAMVEEANAADEAVERRRAEPQGLVRVSAPPALVCFRLAPMIARFMADNPRVRVDLVSTSRRVDVIAEGIDVAIRVRFPPLEESDLVARRLGDSRQRLVAAPALCAGRALPFAPADLAGLPSLALETTAREHAWTLIGAEGAQARIPHAPRLVTDDMSQLLEAALAGVGVAQLPAMVADAPIAEGRLVDLLAGWAPPSGVVQAVFASRRGLLPSVRGLIDFLAGRFAETGA
ncbi:MAG: LysR family transcriptional regulator [Rhizobiales bacterium]|nr:LysR family transcriptional regulator [Hyphomicrobiales bacterium]